jgi:hypothetical protein
MRYKPKKVADNLGTPPNFSSPSPYPNPTSRLKVESLYICSSEIVSCCV